MSDYAPSHLPEPDRCVLRTNIVVDRKEVLRKRHVAPLARRVLRGIRLPQAMAFLVLSAGGHSIDKQAAPGDHTIAGRKALDHLDRVAIGEPGLDPAQLDRFFTVLV